MTELKAWHVFVILGGFFGIMLGVNIVFVTYAYATFTGEDTPLPYLKGLAFNKTLDERSAQRQLGWRITITAVREAGGAAVDVAIADRDGAPQSGLAVDVTFRRPTDAKLDTSAALAAAEAGRYRGTLPALASGQWDVTVQTKTSQGEKIEASRRVLLP